MKELDRTYDENLHIDADYIRWLPDLQNWPSSLIQWAKVRIPKVGIHNFRLPLKFPKKDWGVIELETSVTWTVSLEAHKKWINMSRIMRCFYNHKEAVYSEQLLEQVLQDYVDKIESFEAHLTLKLRYPILKQSLRSDNMWWQYYDISIEFIRTKDKLEKIIHFDFVYSSACPCSFELAEHARQNRNKAVVPHSQRSVARASMKFTWESCLWFEDIRDILLDALKTETQVVVKREDEQAFAELNWANLKFVEDAARLVFAKLDTVKEISDFRVVLSHQESLHSHDAIAVITKWIDWWFNEYNIGHEIYSSLIHKS